MEQQQDTRSPHIEDVFLKSRTKFSDIPEARYEEHRDERDELSPSEFAMVIQGYLREYICMGQCALHIAVAKDPELKKLIDIYTKDVCAPNLESLKDILQKGGYKLPIDPMEAKKVESGEIIRTNTIDDREIVLGHWFDTMGFMMLWNNGAMLSQRTDVRDVFLSNYHRANRWHIAFYDFAIKNKFLMPMPNMSITGLARTAMMGG
jgi:hypothetical protein